MLKGAFQKPIPPSNALTSWVEEDTKLLCKQQTDQVMFNLLRKDMLEGYMESKS